VHRAYRQPAYRYGDMDLRSSKKHALSSDRHARADIEGVADLQRMIGDALRRHIGLP
jgi:hypothetical protein